MTNSPHQAAAAASAIELLAPAGNWNCVRAALANGANAIYFGLDQFNARMRADNFTREDLPRLMPFLKAHGARGYVTMNVLIFPSELEEAASYLDSLDAAGVDGVIVQDMGLAKLISEQRKTGRWAMELHLSTQMTISSPEAIRWLDAELDPQQIVLARELNLKQIAACAQATSKPIEVFCHGALCVAYSGQCLTSESLGQRSANRGECAQACRMNYQLEVDGIIRNMGERRYLFSPQDLCALDRVPEMIRAGVKSFKIEGRLKSPEYVAATTRAYRHAIDAALGVRTSTPAEKMEELYAMQMSFSRGFSSAWLDGTNHAELTHGKFGKKRGVLAGRISDIGRGCIQLAEAPALPIAAGDGFVIDSGQDRNEEQGGRIWKVTNRGRELYFHGKACNIDWQSLKLGSLVWKTADPALDKQLHSSWTSFARPMQHAATGGSLAIHFEGAAHHPLRATCRGITVESVETLQFAQTRPLTPAVIEGQFSRLGGTGYSLGACTFALAPGLMLPLSQLNQMRRDLVGQVPADDSCTAPAREPLSIESPWDLARAAGGTKLRFLCREPEQALALAAEAEGIERLYLDFENPRDFVPTMEKLRQITPKLPIWVATMRVMKPKEAGFLRFIRDAAPDGVLVRNLGALQELKDSGLPLFADFSLNTANPLTADLWRKRGFDGATLSYDLNAQQLKEMLESGCAPFMELTLHQHMPLFHMEHCAFCAFLTTAKNYKDCGQPCRHHRVRVKDRTGAHHYLRADEGCRNTLYNGQAQTAARYIGTFRRAGLFNYRIELLDESAEDTMRLKDAYRRLLSGQDSAAQILEQLHAIDRIGVTEGSLLR